MPRYRSNATLNGAYGWYIRITPSDKTIDGFNCAGSVRGIIQKLAGVDKQIEKAQKTVEQNESDIKILEKQVQGTFPRENVLKAKRKELDALLQDLQDNPVPPPQWLIEGAPMQADVLVDGKKGEVASYRVDPDSNSFYVGVKLEGKDNVRIYPWQKVMDTQGLPMITAPEGVKESPEVDEIEYKAPKEETQEEKPSSNRKYSLDNSDNVEDNIGEKLSADEKKRLYDTVEKHIDEYIAAQREAEEDIEDVLKELTSEHSSHREGLFGHVRSLLTDLRANQGKPELEYARLKKYKHSLEFSAADVSREYQVLIDELQGVLDYGGVLYREITIDRRRNQGVRSGVVSWESAEAQRRKRFQDKGKQKNSIRPTSLICSPYERQ